VEEINSLGHEPRKIGLLLHCLLRTQLTVGWTDCRRGGRAIAGILTAEQVAAEDQLSRGPLVEHCPRADAGGLTVKGAIAGITCERCQDI
jgi:hypothetical protein